MHLADMSARKRRETVNLALAFVLQDLVEPCSTAEVVEMVAVRLETRERELLARTVVALAPSYPEASQGLAFVKFGRSMRRWVWSPRGTVPAVVPATGTPLAPPRFTPEQLAARQAAEASVAGMPDDDWEV